MRFCPSADFCNVVLTPSLRHAQATWGRNLYRLPQFEEAFGAYNDKSAQQAKLRAVTMLDRDVRLAICFLALGVASSAWGQGNLDQGKTAAQLYASDCATCHKSPQSVTQTKWFFGLESFLREHYTSSHESAAILASYLKAQVRPAAQSQRDRLAGTARASARHFAFVQRWRRLGRGQTIKFGGGVKPDLAELQVRRANIFVIGLARPFEAFFGHSAVLRGRFHGNAPIPIPPRICCQLYVSNT
jgi:hypothetical protein